MMKFSEYNRPSYYRIVAFYAFFITECSQLKNQMLFKFIKGDPDAQLEVTLKSKTQVGFCWTLKPLERSGYVEATPHKFDVLKKMQKEDFILDVSVSL